MTEQLLDVDRLDVHFPSRGVIGRKKGVVKAVNQLSFTIGERETLGLVGESGCGKSTTGMAIQGLTKATGGAIRFRGTDLLGLSPRQMRDQRRHIQMVFQDPTASLNARMTVGELLEEPLIVHDLVPPKQRAARVGELLDLVGMPRAAAERYPHEFSGGQRQRIAIARALAVKPSLVVCDEPIAALDVSIRAQVLNLFRDLQEAEGVSYLFISHDLSAVYQIADRILVMYLGQPMEMASRDAIYEETRHPYTQALLSAVPVPDPDVEQNRERILLEGELPSPLNPPSGCVFRTRCERAQDLCATKVPEWSERGNAEKSHYFACHFPIDV